MVSGEVIVKKPFNIKKLILVLVGIIVIGLVLGLVFYIGMILGGIGTPKQANIEYVNPLTQVIQDLKEKGVEVNETQVIEKAEMEFDYTYINYVLFAMSAWKLHNPPLSSETPKIKVIVDDEIYYSEVIDTEMNTYLEEFEGEEDLVITMSKNEVIQAMLAEDMAEFMKQSVASGETQMELVAGSLTLASKGYLQMYKDITGEELEDS